MATKTNVLVIFANPRGTNSLRLGAEDRVIHESIKLSRFRNNIRLDVRHATTVHDLRRTLLENDYQIIHISGHGTGNGLVLEDDAGGVYVVPQQALADLFAVYCPPIECVLLNACYSISQGQLISLGVPFTIAMDGAISDAASIEFTRGFYDALGAGKTVDFAYEEGCRTVKLAAPNTKFSPKILHKGESFLVAPQPAAPPQPGAVRSGETPQLYEGKALVGLAIDLSGSMANNIRNNTGGHVSRLESFRQSLERLTNEAKNRVRASRAQQMQTSIDLFAYGFGLRAMPVCDLLSLIKIGRTMITEEEIEVMKRRYIREAQASYSSYTGLGDLARQMGFGSIVRDVENSIRANAEGEIRRKIMLEIKQKLERELLHVGDTTMPIEEVASLWESSGQTLTNAEELIFGSTPMRECMIEIGKRFDRELRARGPDTTPVCFVLSDGESTDGDPLPAIEALKTLKVTVISCFVTDQDIANPRVLYGQSEPTWNLGAKLLFEMASKVDDDSPYARFLLQKNWTINPAARLFVQVNHSMVLEEFIRVVLSPFEASTALENLPRGV